MPGLKEFYCTEEKKKGKMMAVLRATGSKIRPNVFIKCKIKPFVKRRIVKKWINRFVKYYRKPSKEFGWMALSIHRKWSYLPANISIDDGGLWTNIGNKKIVLFQVNNHEDKDYNKIIPMSIENEPEILVKNENIDLSDTELNKIKEFVKGCKNEIIQLAEDKIDHLKYFEEITNKGFYKTVEEKRKLNKRRF